MLKFNSLKHLVLLVILSLLAGCFGPSDIIKKDTAKAEPISAKQQKVTKKSSTAWQRAYGEKQAAKRNALPKVAAITPKLKKSAPPRIIDLWQRVRNGYAIPNAKLHAKTQKQLAWFTRHPEYVERVVERARPYLYYIVNEIEQRGMPMEIALLPVVESGFQPFAYSSGRAAGLWQFIPGTGKVYGLKQNWWYDGRRDVLESTRAALDYLEKLHNDFGDWQLALAAYNCGEGTVKRAIKKNKSKGKATDFWSLDLPKETSVYVPKLMAVVKLIQQPEKYKITLSPIDNLPYLAVVDTGAQIDLALAAKLADISTEQIYQLNPGFNQWATSPKGPHRLVVPINKAGTFKKALASLSAKDRMQWGRHKIKEGESLGVIAQNYKITPAMLKQANGLGSNKIRAGRYLLIPVASGKQKDYPAVVRSQLATKKSTASRGKKKIHIVKAGDTWWDLANFYNVGVKQLTVWNNKTPSDTLSLGQKLVVWPQAKTKVSNNKVRIVNYEIRSGDSLWKISQKFNVSVAQVRQWNGLSKRTLLRPGQNLTLHVDASSI